MHKTPAALLNSEDDSVSISDLRSNLRGSLIIIGALIRKLGAAEVVLKPGDIEAAPRAHEIELVEDPVKRCWTIKIIGGKPQWQCSACRFGFLGEYQRTCPACGRINYWTGSVYPDAILWTKR